MEYGRDNEDEDEGGREEEAASLQMPKRLRETRAVLWESLAVVKQE